MSHYDGTEQYRCVSNIRTHQLYDYNTRQYDVALLRTTMKFHFSSDGVGPVTFYKFPTSYENRE